MPQYIAFLRGINVGGHRVKMDRLRELFEEVGLTDVSTFIASGNVIFSTRSTKVDRIRAKIETHLNQKLGYDVPTFLRSPDELEAVAAFEPEKVVEAPNSASSVYVIFLRQAPTKELRAALVSLRSQMDDFHFSEREIYWLINGKLTESPLFGPGIDKATRGVETTMRNITTLRRLVAKLAKESGSP